MKTLRNVKNVLLAGLMFFCGSCQTSELPAVCEGMETTDVTVAEAELDSIVMLARNGHADAYHALAIRYRDGNGVPQSNLNALFAQSLYTRLNTANGCSHEDVFDENHPYYPLAVMLSSPDDSDLFGTMIEKMETACPMEFEAFKTVADYGKTDNSTIIRRLDELENEGSEMSVLLCGYVYQTSGDTKNFISFFNSRADEYPMLHAVLGEHYECQYWGSDDPDDLEKALEHYGKADAAAMLTPKYANRLYQLRDNLGQTGKLPLTDEKEMERLKRLATVFQPTE